MVDHLVYEACNESGTIRIEQVRLLNLSAAVMPKGLRGQSLARSLQEHWMRRVYGLHLPGTKQDRHIVEFIGRQHSARKRRVPLKLVAWPIGFAILNPVSAVTTSSGFEISDHSHSPSEICNSVRLVGYTPINPPPTSMIRGIYRRHAVSIKIRHRLISKQGCGSGSLSVPEPR